MKDNDARMPKENIQATKDANRILTKASDPHWKEKAKWYQEKQAPHVGVRDQVQAYEDRIVDGEAMSPDEMLRLSQLVMLDLLKTHRPGTRFQAAKKLMEMAQDMGGRREERQDEADKAPEKSAADLARGR
jgi:hypothetical protein